MTYEEWIKSLEVGFGVVSGHDTYTAGFAAAKAEVQEVYDKGIYLEDIGQAVESWLH